MSRLLGVWVVCALGLVGCEGSGLSERVLPGLEDPTQDVRIAHEAHWVDQLAAAGELLTFEYRVSHWSDPGAAFEVALDGGYGNADLVVVHVGDASARCESNDPGNDDFCAFGDGEIPVMEGVYRIEIRATEAFSGLGVHVTENNLSPDLGDLHIESWDGIAASAWDPKTFEVAVGPGAVALSVDLIQGDGDADLKIWDEGSLVADCRSNNGGSELDSCEIAAPSEGIWTIQVTGWTDFSGAEVRASWW